MARNNFSGLKGLFEFLQTGHIFYGLLVTGFGFTSGLIYSFSDSIQVGHNEFHIDYTDVICGINLAMDVSDIFINESTDYLGNSIGFADIGEEFVAEALTGRGAFYQTG